MDMIPNFGESDEWQPEIEPDMPTDPGRQRALAKALALLDTPGAVRLTEGGASVTNGEGHVYRVELDWEGGPRCWCACFMHRGYCKHVYAAQAARAAAMQEEYEDDEPTDEEWYAELEHGYYLDVMGGRR